MPKTPSRMSKKKKFNSRFPPARIKKIMQTDEDVGKVAAAVPIIISRALELFIESLITETSQTTIAKNAKTLSTSHIKQTIHSNKQFDFLRDLVANIPDHNTEDSIGNTIGNGTGDAAQGNGDIPQKKKRGRPRKIKEAPILDRKKHGESSKVSSETSEEEEDDDEDEETESDDDDKAQKPPVTSSNHTARSLPSSSTSSLSYAAAQHNSGSLTMNTSGPQNCPTQFPPGYSVPALASLTNQQQQLQLPQQMMAHHQPPQQQHSMGSTPSSSSPSTLSHHYVPPTTLSTLNPSPLTNILLPVGAEGYPIPPQFHHNPYHQVAVQMMPQAHQPLHQQALHPGVPGYPVLAHHMPAPVHLVSSPKAQVQPINLSMSSQRGPHPSDQAEDYDS